MDYCSTDLLVGNTQHKWAKKHWYPKVSWYFYFCWTQICIHIHFQQEHPKSTSGDKAAHYPYISPDLRFGESAWWSRSYKKINQLFLIPLQSYPEISTKSTHNLLKYGQIEQLCGDCNAVMTSSLSHSNFRHAGRHDRSMPLSWE